MNLIVNEIKNRFFKKNHPLYGLEIEKEQIKEKIKVAYEHGESNSLLIVGKSGSGKSHMIKSIIKELEKDSNYRENMHKINLDGTIHTDDTIALKSISRQLKISLTDNEEELTNTRLNDCFQFILSVLASGNRSSVSLLIIIENFDLFLYHRNQMLIYNLFNSVQTVGTPICVIGITCRLDVLELMEKRVKSRFSHHQIILQPFTNTLDKYKTAARDLLTIPVSDHKRRSVAYNSAVAKWNKRVNSFLNDSDVLSILEQSFFISDTIASLKTLLILPVSQVSVDNPKLSIENLEKSWQNMNFDDKTALLNGLNELEYVLIAILNRFMMYTEDDINFEKVYKEYQNFCRDNGRLVHNKQIMRAAMDMVIEKHLVNITSNNKDNMLRNYDILTCQVTQDQLVKSLQSRGIGDLGLRNYLQFELIQK